MCTIPGIFYSNTGQEEMKEMITDLMYKQEYNFIVFSITNKIAKWMWIWKWQKQYAYKRWHEITINTVISTPCGVIYAHHFHLRHEVGAIKTKCWTETCIQHEHELIGQSNKENTGWVT